jgi:hypothetical protein
LVDGVTGEGDLLVVLAIDLRLEKERGDGRELVKAGRHRGQRCQATVNSQQWVKRTTSASLWDFLAADNNSRMGSGEGVVWECEDVGVEAG